MAKQRSVSKRETAHRMSWFARSIAISFILAGVLGAQDTPPRLHVAHPWDPSTPIPAPSTLRSASLNVALSSTVWSALGPAPIVNGQRPGNGPVSGRLAGIAAHPTDPNTIYVAPAGGGVWKTTDGGSTWTALTDTQATLSMGAIAVAPSNPSVIYAGTGEANNSADSNFGRGVLVSTDAGATWTLRNNGGAFDRRTVSEIAIDPTNTNIAYAAIANFGVNGLGGNTGIWKTTDGGVSWTNTTTAITSSQPWSSVRIDVNNPSILYAAVGNLFGTATNGVYKTINAGVSWSLLSGAPSGTTSGRIVVAVAPSNSQTLYVSSSSPITFGLSQFIRSDNAGTSFTALSPPNYMGGQGWYDTTLIVDPTNDSIVYAGGAAGTNSIIRSVNRGVSWSDISNSSSPSTGPHVDHHAAAFDAAGRFLDGDDGGIYRLDNPSPVTWTHLNGNLNTIQFQGVGMHPTDTNTALGGSQDNGTSRYSGTLSWALVEGGDGGPVKFSKTTTTRVYHDAPVGSFGPSAFFRRSDNGGTTWLSKVTGITDNNSSLQNFYSPFVVDPGNGDRVLFGARHVWETTNAGDSWSAVGAAFANNVDSIGLAPSDVNTIYASAAGSTFFTNNHGASWTMRNLPVGGTVSDIEVSPTDSMTAFAVVSAFTSGGNVFQTVNGGVTWTNITGNLPNAPVWSFQIDPALANTLYVGTDSAVYMTTNGGSSWSRMGSGFPNAQVFQIELNNTTRVLGAATHGRGAWEILVPTTIGTTLTLSPPTLPSGIVGTAYNQTLTGSGGTSPYTFTVIAGALPNGLTLNGSTGVISGTPTTSNTFNFTVRLQDSAFNTTDVAYTVKISTVVSTQVTLTVNSTSYDPTPSPGFEGKYTINATLTNGGPNLSAPMFFRITTEAKVGTDLNPSQPDKLLSADDGAGLVGDDQTLGIASLPTGAATPANYLEGVGSRQPFRLFVDFYGVLPGPGSGGGGGGDPTLITRFQFDISDGSIISTSRSSANFSIPTIVQNMGVITGPGSQSRPALATDASSPSHSAVASNDYAARSVEVATTQDGGKTWQTTPMSRSLGSLQFSVATNPSLTFDSRGYLSVVYTLSNLNDSANAIVVSESRDGANFSPPAAISFHPAADRFIDSRPVIVIQPGVGRYVAWDSLSSVDGTYDIRVAQSVEGGSFGPAISVVHNARASSPALAVGNNTLYVGWDEWGFNSVFPYTTGGRLVTSSAPLGPQLLFSKPQEIAQTSIGFSQKIAAMPERGAGPNLNLAVDPKNDDFIYAAFADRGNGMDIRFSISHNGGKTWAPARVVNDDANAADQFNPALGIDSQGNVNIAFYDTRLSIGSTAADVFMARSTNGNRFDANRRITSAPSDDSKLNPLRDYTANLGDRIALSATTNKVVVAWTDTRQGSEDIVVGFSEVK